MRQKLLILATLFCLLFFGACNNATRTENVEVETQAVDFEPTNEVNSSEYQVESKKSYLRDGEIVISYSNSLIDFLSDTIFYTDMAGVPLKYDRNKNTFYLGGMNWGTLDKDNIDIKKNKNGSLTGNISFQSVNKETKINFLLRPEPIMSYDEPIVYTLSAVINGKTIQFRLNPTDVDRIYSRGGAVVREYEIYKYVYLDEIENKNIEDFVLNKNKIEGITINSEDDLKDFLDGKLFVSDNGKWFKWTKEYGGFSSYDALTYQYLNYGVQLKCIQMNMMSGGAITPYKETEKDENGNEINIYTFYLRPRADANGLQKYTLSIPGVIQNEYNEIYYMAN